MQRVVYLIGYKINLITARDQGLQHPHPLTDSLPPHLKENGRTDEQKEAQTATLNLHESTAARWRWKYAGNGAQYPLCKAVAVCGLPSPCPDMYVPLGLLLIYLLAASVSFSSPLFGAFLWVWVLLVQPHKISKLWVITCHETNLCIPRISIQKNPFKKCNLLF